MAQLRNVNTTDILGAIRLGCRTMSSVFNRDDNDIPFFGSQAWPSPHFSFSSAHSEAHVPGRHLNALLAAGAMAGIEIDEQAVEKHAAAAFYSYSGALPLPLNRQTIDGPLINFFPHNIREGFHALHALARYRDSARARELFEASLAAIDRLWDPERGWDRGHIEGMLGLTFHDSSFICGLARSIGPLVKYYDATAYQPALDLAIRLKDKALEGAFPDDGAYDIAIHGSHVHSTTCTMSGLAQLASRTGDNGLLQRVKAFYDNGLWQLRDELGWSIENAAPDCQWPDLGEANNTGDILETALILGHAGFTEYYGDAERILRGHLLPSQLRDVSFIADPPNPENHDALRNVADRHRGAWGFPAPYAHAAMDAPCVGFNLDIVGGATASLCEAYRAMATYDGNEHHLNLLFDCDTAAIRVKSPYTHDSLEVTLKQPGSLKVRMPCWVEQAGLIVTGAPHPPRFSNGFAIFEKPSTGVPVTMRYPLPVREAVLENHKRAIRYRVRGDEVIAMDNFGTGLTYFADFD